MKLFRFGAEGSEKPGVELSDGTKLDVSSLVKDFDADFFGSDGVATLRTRVEKEAAKLPKVTGSFRFAAPLTKPPAIIAVGLNYKLHAEESGAKLPAEPVLFFKHPASYAAPFSDVPIPLIPDVSNDGVSFRQSSKTDYEVELGVVIGKSAYRIAKADWQKHVAGYTLLDDVSERECQLDRSGTWDKGKGFPGFSPIGPFIVPASEIDPGNLDLWLEVNGERRQASNTADMAFPVPFLVWYTSQFFRLEPGTVITTGTPSGVAMGLKPSRYLQHGDVVRLGIDGIGEMQHTFVNGE